MRVIVNTFGTDVTLRQEISLKPASAGLRDVLALSERGSRAPLERFLTDDLSPVEGAAILINGRNMWSLDPYEITVHDGDELTFTVLVAGG